MKKYTKFFIIPVFSALLAAITSPAVLPGIPKAFADPKHCDRLGYPLCYDLGHKSGQESGSGSCKGHSHNYCVGLKAGVNGQEDDTCENPNQPPGVAGCPNDK